MILIIDASYWIHQAAAVMPGLHRSNGQPIGATLGYATRLWNIIARPPEPFSHIVACLDAGGETWRHRLMPGYKQSRVAATAEAKDRRNELFGQRDTIDRATRVLGGSVLARAGVEADDLIADVVQMATRNGLASIVVSSDKDLMQLVRGDGEVRVWDSAKREMLRSGDVYRRYGVWPRQIPDMLALVGDTADDIPGVKGIGKKKAADLLTRFADVEGVIDGAYLETTAIFKSIQASVDQIRLSRQIATLRPGSAPIAETIDDFAWRQPDRNAVMDFCEEMEFAALAKTIDDQWEEITL